MPEQKSEWLEQAIVPIREKCDIIINVSTGGAGKRVDGDWLYKEQPEETVKGRIAVVGLRCGGTRVSHDHNVSHHGWTCQGRF